MYLCFALGVACAVGHHAFYQSLDGRVADSQTQMLRYGTLLAFAAKAWLSAAVVQAFRQRVWAAVRTRFMAVAAVDALFAAAEDLTAFLSRDLFRGSGTAAALAAFVCVAPLMVILTANTLLVELRTVSVAGPAPESGRSTSVSRRSPTGGGRPRSTASTGSRCRSGTRPNRWTTAPRVAATGSTTTRSPAPTSSRRPR